MLPVFNLYKNGFTLYVFFVSHFFCSVLCIQFICVAADSCDSFICIIIFHCIGEGNGNPTPVFLSGKSHGWRSLVGYSVWGCEESDTTELLHFHFSLSCIGEGNGNPLQCSCLENPRDGGAWWAAIHEVAQSRTRLKRLSSISSYHHRKSIIAFLFDS